MYGVDCVFTTTHHAHHVQQQKNHNKISQQLFQFVNNAILIVSFRLIWGSCVNSVGMWKFFRVAFEPHTETRFQLNLSLYFLPSFSLTQTSSRMAADSDGNANNLTAVVICEGDYHDPTFPLKLNNLVARLNSLIEEQPKSKRLKVNKVSVVF